MAGTATVGILRVLLTANSAEFDAAMTRASARMGVLSKDLGTMGRQATQIGAGLTKTLTVPILGLGVGAAKLAMDFESSFAGVRKTVDGVVDKFGNLTKAGQEIQQGLRDMAKEIPVTVTELTKIAESAGQMNIPKENLLEFTRVMADLGVTTNLTSDQAAVAVGNIQNIFGAAGKDVDRFGATLVALGNNGASTEKDIVEMSMRIAGAGHTVGLSQAEVLGFANALASVGIKAEAGGSAISRTFLKINDAVASGGPKLEEFARVAGMTAQAFKEAFEKNAAGATATFIEGLKRLKDSGENVNATLEGLVGKNIIIKDTLLRTSGAGDLLRESLNLANQAWKDNTALVNEARERYKTTESQLMLLWNRLKDVGITLGNALLPTINLTIKAVGDLIPVIDALAKGFNGMPLGVQAAVIGFGLAVAAVGPLLFVFGQILLTAGFITQAFTEKGIAARALGHALAFLSVPVLAIGGLIGGLAVIWANFKDDWVRAFDILIPPLGIFRSGLDAVKRAIEPHLPLIRDLATIVDSLFVIAWHNAKIMLLSLKDAVLVPLRTEWNLWKIAIADIAGTLSTLLMPVIQQLLPGMLLLVELNRRLGQESDVVKLAVRLLAGDLKAAADAQKGISLETERTTKAQKDAASATAEWQGPVQSMIARQKSLTEALAKTRAELRALTVEQRAEIQAGIAAGDSNKEVAAAMNLLWPALKLTETHIKVYKDSLKETGKAAKETAKDLTELTAAQDALFGRDLIAKANDYIKALGNVSNITKLSAEKKLELHNVVTAALDAIKRGAATVLPEYAERLREIEAATRPLIVSTHQWAVVELQAAIDNLTPFEHSVRSLGFTSVPMFSASIHHSRLGLVGYKETVKDTREGIRGAATDTQHWTDSLSGLAQGLANLAQISGDGRFSEITRWLATIVSAMDIANKSVVQFSKGLDTFNGGKQAAGFTQMAAGALSLVAALHQATESTNKFKGALAGVLAMAGTGNVWLMLAGGVYGYIRGLQGAQDQQRMLAAQFRKDLAAISVEAHKVMDQAWVIGLDEQLRVMLSTAKTQEDLQRIAELIDVIKNNYGQLKDEAGGLFDELMTLAGDAGGIPDSMRDLVQHFSTLGFLTDEQKKKLQALGDSGTVSLDKMSAAAEVIKARFESLGPAFNQERLNRDAMKVVNALGTLIKGGADVGGVLFDAREEIGEVVRESIKFGTTIPANMKPWIDHLFETGNLLDENGDKITDISKIKYGEPLKTEAEKITEAFKTMTDKLIAFFDRLGQEILRIPDRKVKIIAEYDDSGLPREWREGGGGDDDTIRPMPVPYPGNSGQGMATGTMGRLGKWFGKFDLAGEPAMLHGEEAVVRKDQAVSFAWDVLATLLGKTAVKSFAGGTVGGTAFSAPYSAAIAGMSSAERAALMQGMGDFKGTIEAFLSQQALLYTVAKEGDRRLKTWLSAETLTTLGAAQMSNVFIRAIVQMGQAEREALATGMEGFEGTVEAFLSQQALLYTVAQEGDKRLKTWLSGETLEMLGAAAASDVFIKAITQMGDAERHALAAGMEGFKGTVTEFLAEQAALYQHAKEGDARLKTWLSAETLATIKANEAGERRLKLLEAEQKLAAILADMHWDPTEAQRLKVADGTDISDTGFHGGQSVLTRQEAVDLLNAQIKQYGGAPASLSMLNQIAGAFGFTGETHFNTGLIQKFLGSLEASFLRSFKIPHLADGGVVTAPMLALIGERGPELVAPLSSNVGGTLTASLRQEFRSALEEFRTLNAITMRDAVRGAV